MRAKAWVGAHQNVDRVPLAAYCESWATFAACNEAIRSRGLTYQVRNRSGTFYNERPEVKIRDRALTQIRQFSAEFGFTPSSRGKIQIPEAEPKDLLWEALNKPRKIKKRSE